MSTTEESPQLMRGPLGCNASRSLFKTLFDEHSAIKQGQLGLLNEEQKTAWRQLNWQRACREHKAGHRGPPVARLTDSELRTVPSIPPPRQAAVKSVKEVMRWGRSLLVAT